jgi:hypothetical protein
MKYHVGDLRKTVCPSIYLLICYLAIFLLHYTVAQVNVCDQTQTAYYEHGFESQDELYTYCVANGQTIVDDVETDNLRHAISQTDLPIRIQPTSQQCLSPLYKELVCKKNADFFDGFEGGCPLSSPYEFNEVDLFNAFTKRLYNVCSPFSIPAIFNPIELGPGKLDWFSSGNNETEMVTNNISLKGLEFEEASISNNIIAGDLTIEKSKAGYISIENSVILGDFILDTSPASISVNNVWILGNLIVDNNYNSEDRSNDITLFNLNVRNNLILSNNKFRTFSFDSIVVRGEFRFLNNEIYDSLLPVNIVFNQGVEDGTIFSGEDDGYKALLEEFQSLFHNQ